jgi:hypothetical protein
VTGIGFVPSGPHNYYDDGAWLIPAGFDRLFGGAHYAFKFHVATVALRPGADVKAVTHRLTAKAAAIKGGQAFTFAVRRRRHELAVLRALGLTRRQSRLVIVTQATLLAVIGLAFGIPLGIALGRTLWRAAADMTPLAYHAPVALWALALIGPLALVAANLLAAWPARRAARLRTAHILRTE